jgi:hypothetical protein
MDAVLRPAEVRSIRTGGTYQDRRSVRDYRPPKRRALHHV